MPQSSPIIPLHIEPIDGPALKPIALRDGRSATFGRSASCACLLDHHAISREHMAITHREGLWYVTDHGSRNGTRLNGFALPPGEPTPIADADHLQVGPWTFRARLGDPGTRIETRTIDDDATTSQRLRTTGLQEVDSRMRQQFASLLRASALLHSVKNEHELLDCLLQTAQSATAFERAAIIRRTGSIESVEVVAQRFREEMRSPSAEGFHFSRSLLRAAQNGPFAVVSEGLSTPKPETMVRFDIAAAACAPIRLNEAVWGYLYLDSGASTPPTGTGELLELIRSLADIASLALVRVKQVEVSRRLEDLKSDMEVAGEIQRFLLPPAEGRVGPLRYAMRSKPGRIVSGDLFDIIPLGETRAAVLMGDVMGKGLGAGLVMSSVQSYLHCLLRESHDPGEALEELNRFLSPRVTVGRFVSLWLGIFDLERRTLVAADAGHGYSVIVDPKGVAAHVHCAGGTPLAAQEHCSYASTALAFGAGSRLVLFSDGVVEARSASGEAFGIARLTETVSTLAGPEADIHTIFERVRAFAGPSAPSDDMTAASIRFD